MGVVEAKMLALGVELHTPETPSANYIPFVQAGNLLFVAGHVCLAKDGSLTATGKLGDEVSIEAGMASARQCAINVLSVVKSALGDLDRVARVVRLGGFVNSTPDFTDGPTVLNGASDLMVALFGEKGRHVRTTVGVATLPMGAAVEVDGIFEIA